MRGFVNPIFQPVDENIEVASRRTFELQRPSITTASILPLEYERIFSSFTDQSQQLNDSILQPFDNSKFLCTMEETKNDITIQGNQSKPQQNVIFDKARLQQILQLIENKSPGKQQQNDIAKQSYSKLEKSLGQKQQTKIQKVQELKKSFSGLQNQRIKAFFINNEKGQINEEQKQKYRSSTNHTAREKSQFIKNEQLSSSNINYFLEQHNKEQYKKDQQQYRTYSQREKVEKLGDRIGQINEKIVQLSYLVLKQVKLQEKKDLINKAINNLIQENTDNQKLSTQIEHLRQLFNNLRFDQQKYIILFNISKIVALGLEKQSRISHQYGQRQCDVNDDIKSPHTPNKLSRQTTSDNIVEELITEKKQFFQLVVSLKLNLPFNHKGKELLLNDLYEKALKLSVKKVNWQQFIMNEMKY